MTVQLGTTLNWNNIEGQQTLELNSSELQLWWLPLTINEQQRQLTLNWLNERQHNKYQRRSSKELKDAYLAGRYYLLTLLAAYSNCKPNEVKLTYSRLNKPSLETPCLETPIDTNSNNKIHFNFTDTNIDNKSYALFAFCREHQIGVDLESCSRSNEFEKIARRRFTPTELNYASNSQGQLDQQRCLAIWTRKEAYGKAVGIGINFQMNERNLVSDNFDHSPFSYNFNDGDNNWRLLQIQPDPKFIASVVHQSHQELKIIAFNRPYQIA